MKTRAAFFVSALASIVAFAFPGAPKEAGHPGSQIYSYGVEEKTIKCSAPSSRELSVFVPVTETSNQTFPAVVYGHGQALGLKHYKATFQHLAKKGVAVIFPQYDTGFFDRDWNRMGRDFVKLADCAIAQTNGKIRLDQIIFSGHSKGAYVASVASGLAFKEKLSVQPRSVLLFATAGLDKASLAYLNPETEMTVVFSDADTVVERSLSEQTYNSAPSKRKQFIFMKSYASHTGKSVKADHFWPVTESSLVGGGPESELHYYGSWKWLVAAAWDLDDKSLEPGSGTQEFLYGNLAADKGVPGLEDDIKRSW